MHSASRRAPHLLLLDHPAWLMLAAAVTLGGCAWRAALVCPDRGGHSWHQLESPRFRLWTDAPPARAAAALAEFEAAAGVFETLVFPAAPPLGERTDLVLFDRERDFEAIAPTGVAGWFHPVDDGGIDEVPLMVLRGGDPPSVRRRFQHELVHRFMAARGRRLPPWLEEGLAEYYSTLRIEGGDGDGGSRRAVVGELQTRALFITDELPGGGLGARLVDHRVPLYEVPHLPDLLAASESEFHQPDRELAFYAASWALVHLLLSTPDHATRLHALVDDLVAGRAPADAWRRRFGDLPPDRLDAEYRRHLEREELPPTRVPLAAAPPGRAPVARALRDDEVHLLWARVRPWSSRENIVAAGADLAAALAPPHPSPEAHYWMSLYHRKWRRFAAAERELRLAVAARQDDPRYLRALAVVLRERAAATPPGGPARSTKAASGGKTLTVVDE